MAFLEIKKIYYNFFGGPKLSRSRKSIMGFTFIFCPYNPKPTCFQLETKIARDSTLLIRWKWIKNFRKSTANCVSMRETEGREKSNKCNQCDYACSDPSALRLVILDHFWPFWVIFWPFWFIFDHFWLFWVIYG